jgi:hypothetical protein
MSETWCLFSTTPHPDPLQVTRCAAHWRPAMLSETTRPCVWVPALRVRIVSMSASNACTHLRGRRRCQRSKIVSNQQPIAKLTYCSTETAIMMLNCQPCSRQVGALPRF